MPVCTTDNQNITDASGITQAPAADGGVQQIPAMIPVSAADDARDALLRAISAEARHVADKSAGQASPAWNNSPAPTPWSPPACR